jgi:hypothetical protein
MLRSTTSVRPVHVRSGARGRVAVIAALVLSMLPSVTDAASPELRRCFRRWRASPWSFCSAQDRRADTGSHALDQYRRRWAALGTVLGLGVVALAVAIPIGARATDDNTLTASALVVFGSVLTLGVGIPVIVVRAGRGGMRRNARIQLTPTSVRVRF